MNKGKKNGFEKVERGKITSMNRNKAKKGKK